MFMKHWDPRLTNPIEQTIDTEYSSCKMNSMNIGERRETQTGQTPKKFKY